MQDNDQIDFSIDKYLTFLLYTGQGWVFQRHVIFEEKWRVSVRPERVRYLVSLASADIIRIVQVWPKYRNAKRLLRCLVRKFISPCGLVLCEVFTKFRHC